MKGVRYLIDDRGDKTAVVIDLKLHRELWEDVYDTLTARRRRSEPRESLPAVKRRLQRAKLPTRCPSGDFRTLSS